MGPEDASRTGSIRRDERPFTYADYLELYGWEFDKFRQMPPITAEEVEAIDWDDLFDLLLRPFGG